MDLLKNKHSSHFKSNRRVDMEIGSEDMDNPTNTLSNSNLENALIQWRGPEYQVYPKDKRWYMIASIVLISIISYALFSNSPIMAITFILIGAVGYIYLEKGPRVLDFAITENGIVTGKEIYEHEDIESFCILYSPPHTRILSLDIKGTIIPYIHIPIHQIDPGDLAKTLREFISEKKQEPSFIDTIERLFHI